MTALDLPVDAGVREMRAGWFAIAAFFGLGGLWAAFAPLDAATVAPGVVVVLGNRQTIQHREGGVVSQILVKEGQVVRARDLLIALNAPEITARERALLSQILDLQVRRARLIAEISGSAKIETPPEWDAFSPEDKALAREALTRRSDTGASTHDARIAGYLAEIESTKRQEVLLNDELRGMRTLLEKQLVPITQVRALERALAELEGRRGTLDASIAETRESRNEELRTVEARLAEIEPQWRGALQQAEQTRLRAPTDGAVVGLNVHTIGGVVRPGDRLMDIVPNDQQLVIEAQVRPEDADDLSIGLDAEIRVTAFNAHDLPLLHGTVKRVSADRFVDERNGAGYFTAQVEVPPEELALLERSGASLGKVRPGLPAEVVIRTRKRTALEFLLEPLNQRLWRSFRES